MTLALTQTHIIEQHFYTQRSSSKIALLHKKPAGPLLHFIFFPKQLKANLIRINYISHGLQGFKQCLFNLIFFFFFYKPRTSFQSTHEGRCSRSDIWPPEIECVCVCVWAYVSVFASTCIRALCPRRVWSQRDSVITPAVSEWQSLWVLRCQLTPGSDPDWQSYSESGGRANRSWTRAVLMVVRIPRTSLK